jgi:hypothetical protein
MEKSINGESSGGFSVATAMMEPDGISHRMLIWDMISN